VDRHRTRIQNAPARNTGESLTQKCRNQTSDEPFDFAFQVQRGILSGQRKEQAELRGAEWADWDMAGRLVFARSGCLCAANLDAFPEIRETELVDLNMLKPEPIASPEWARRW
jgi:hypothetical protein